MFREMSSSEMSAFAEGYVPLKSVFRMPEVAEAIKPRLAKIEAGESLRVEGQETITGADLLANLAVTQHYLDSAPVYSIDAPDRDIVKITKNRPVSDFKPVKIFSTTETENFDEVKEAEDYKSSSFGDSYTEVAVKKWGKTIRISWETLISDTLGELADLQAKLVRSGKRTLFKSITDIFAENSTFFSVGNKNLGSGALNEANLEELLKLIAGQKDASSNPLYLRAKYLVVPPALEFKAKRLVNPMFPLAVAKLDEMPSKFDLEVIVAPDLTSTTGYYVFSDPNDYPAISLVTLNGHQGIELLVKVSDQRAITSVLNGELGSFQNDTIELKARMFFNPVLRYPQAAAYSTGV